MKIINKALATREDLALGAGLVQQQRGNGYVVGSKIELNWILRTIDEIRALDVLLYTRVQLHQAGSTKQYWYDSTSTAVDDSDTVLTPSSNPASGRWLLASSDFISTASIPLAGTASGMDITGLLRFSTPVGAWSLQQGDFFGANAFLLNALNNNALFGVSTKDAVGNDNSLTYNGDGKLATTGVVVDGDADGTYPTKVYVDTKIASIGGTPADAVLITGDQSIAGTKTFTGSTTVVQTLTSIGDIAVGTFGTPNSVLASGALGIMVESGILTNQIALNTRTITAGTGLQGGGDLTADRTISVDGTVVRTTGDQSISGTKTFTGLTTAVQSLAVTDNVAIGTLATPGRLLSVGTLGIITDSGLLASQIALNTVQIASGDGLSGGGSLTATRTLSVDNTVFRTTGAQTATAVKTFAAGARFGNTITAPNASNSAVFENTIALENPGFSSGSIIVTNFGVLAINSSDETLKTNIRDSEHGLATVLAIRAIQYGRDPEKHEISEDTGFSAQQLQTVLPEAAPYNEAQGLFGYRDTPIVSALVKGMQEQQAMIDELKAKVAGA